MFLAQLLLIILFSGRNAKIHTRLPCDEWEAEEVTSDSNSFYVTPPRSRKQIITVHFHATGPLRRNHESGKEAVMQTWIPDPSGTVIFQTQLRLLR